MYEISKAENWPLALYPKVENPTENVLSKYAIIVKYDGGYIVHHTITWCMWFITEEEYSDILNIDKFKELKIVLDKSVDEVPIAEKVYLCRSEQPNKYTYTNVTSFVILTTSACNARCWYCYESGIKPIGMTKKTAEDIVQFIKRVKNPSRRVKIRWFGGEPLLRTDIIDYIVNRLEEDGIKFTSDIISNAYLANDKVVDSFDKWKITQVQVTIDGLKEKYNTIKNYVTNDADPFETVMSNIHRIAKKGTKTVLRINVSEDNINEVDELLEYLTKEFGEYSNVSIYTCIVYQYKKTEKENELFSRLLKLSKKYKGLTVNGYRRNKIKRKNFIKYCGHETGTAVTIHPSGKFGPCEHWSDERVLGDVVNGLTNEELAEKWRRKDGENTAICKKYGCPLLPTCKHYCNCGAGDMCISEDNIKMSIDDEKQIIINTYKYWKKKYGLQ